MAQQVTLQAQPRTTTGKGAARSLRRQGQVPAVIYGHGRDPEPLVVSDAALEKLLATVSGSTVIDVEVAGRAPVKALVREVQRNPVRPTDVLHVDLYEVRADEEITVDVAVRLVGTPEGVRNFGGVLDQALYTLTLEVLPADIPEHIDLDVSGLNIGQVLHVSDVTVPKARILNDPEAPVCSVVAPRTEEEAPAAEAATAEPELIRKPKADEDAGEE